MSESDATPEAIDDEQLPEDLRPDDNPLAEGLEPGETVDDLLTGGKHAEQSDESDTQDGGDGAS
jgi:hypothetical protein